MDGRGVLYVNVRLLSCFKLVKYVRATSQPDDSLRDTLSVDVSLDPLSTEFFDHFFCFHGEAGWGFDVHVN